MSELRDAAAELVRYWYDKLGYIDGKEAGVGLKIRALRAALSAPDPMRRIEDVTRDCCSCGGGGPDDPHTCPACMVWHRMKGLTP